jgi:malto-oligosyltrehalose trehalohydrolase
VHAIAARGEPNILESLSRAVGDLARETGREIHLVLENDDNEASLLDPAVARPSGKYRAQWNDDYHHAWHVQLTREDRGYYVDYSDAPREKIARSLASGYVFQGDPSQHRRGAPRGEASSHLPSIAFVNFLQNHDQVGNRAFGERLSDLAPAASIEAALTIMLLAPSPPLLFMGEEWGAVQPFPFFCDFRGDLADAVRNGRRREFEAQFSDANHDEIPDPLAEATFRSAVLNWDDRAREPHASRLKLVRELLALRRDHTAQFADAYTGGSARAEAKGDVLIAHWAAAQAPRLSLIANLSESECTLPASEYRGEPIWGGVPGAKLRPWAVHWAIEKP